MSSIAAPKKRKLSYLPNPIATPIHLTREVLVRFLSFASGQPNCQSSTLWRSVLRVSLRKEFPQRNIPPSPNARLISPRLVGRPRARRSEWPLRICDPVRLCSGATPRANHLQGSVGASGWQCVVSSGEESESPSGSGASGVIGSLSNTTHKRVHKPHSVQLPACYSPLLLAAQYLWSIARTAFNHLSSLARRSKVIVSSE